MKPEIFSEIGSIERVFVYSPGEEHNLVLPKDIKIYLENNSSIFPNEDFLLFDDLIDLKIAKKQHEMASVKYSLSHEACRITFMNNKVTPLLEHLTLDGSMNQKMWYNTPMVL